LTGFVFEYGLGFGFGFNWWWCWFRFWISFPLFFSIFFYATCQANASSCPEWWSNYFAGHVNVCLICLFEFSLFISVCSVLFCFVPFCF
jgi:hypothetical protein